MHTITFSSMTCKKNRISQTVKLNSLERCVILWSKKKFKCCPLFHALLVVWWFPAEKWNPCIQHWLAMTNKKLCFSSYTKLAKEQSVKQIKAILKFNFPFIGCQVFFPMLFTEGNNLNKSEKHWSKIRNNTFSVAVSNFIFEARVLSQNISIAESYRIIHTLAFHIPGNVQAYVQSLVERGDWNRGILFLGTVSDLCHLE